MRIIVISAISLALTFRCSVPEIQQDAVFSLIPSSQSGVDFVNSLENTEDFNIFGYRNFYNGGGVALGDINNDGLPDIYFTSNLGENKLYLNQGNFKFKDISHSAGVEGTRKWSTGVIMVDINNDGFLDIYVCNAGYLPDDDRQNELFVNNGDLTFTESAVLFGLDENGYTTHAAFFDYDTDGDLDAYILNNSFIPVNTLNYSNKRELFAEDWPVKEFIKGGGDKLLRNDEGTYVDVTKTAGIYGSLIGFGLGITVGDINRDALPDLYISNDFFERDYLYINQGDGTFSEELTQWMGHISLSSMGADMADINNDGLPEIFVTEMLPADDKRVKSKVLFENYNIYELKQKRDFYHQYMHNTLQFNNGNNSFSEIAWYSGISASDWSWGALIFDADNDGLKDIFVCNGVYQDVTDLDFMDFFANDMVQEMALTGKKEALNKVLDAMPSIAQPNKFFHNQSNLQFKESGLGYGLDKPSFSNGSAYGDLDLDGDLDLVVNNLNQESFIYRNNINKQADHHWLGFRLKGPEKNLYAIGTKITAYVDQERYSKELIPSRGFQSSIDYKMIIGIGIHNEVDSIGIIWPDRSSSVLYPTSIDTLLALDYQELARLPYKEDTVVSKPILEAVAFNGPKHSEDDFIDFYQEGLSFRMLSREGPAVAVGDVNGDGMEDLYFGGSSQQAGLLLLQGLNGFSTSKQESFTRDAYFEDVTAEFVDVDADGDLDLYVGSGGNNRPVGSRLMQDRVYKNDGKGLFVLDARALPNYGYNTSVVKQIDLNGDQYPDLFVGSRSIPMSYGLPPKSYVYRNQGDGSFEDVTDMLAPEVSRAGMITDATLSDITGDGSHELIVTGEWMHPLIYQFEQGQMKKMNTGLEPYRGWWYAVASTDLDQDGDYDLVLGNRGENFYFSATESAPAKLWVNDFDNNGTVDKIITQYSDGVDLPLTSKRELTNQIVSLKKSNLKHSEYATRSIQELFSPEIIENALVLEATYFKSAVAINQGDGTFEIVALPKEVQLSNVNAIQCMDINSDGYPDLVLGGNDSGFIPQFSRLDASYGHILINETANNYNWIPHQKSGFMVRGEIKELRILEMDKQHFLLTAINNQPAKLYKLSQEDLKQ